FILAVVVTAVGSIMAVPAQPVEEATTLPTPLITVFIWMLLNHFRLTPSPPQGQILYMHPVEFAGWVGLLITTLNLLPAAMLDGGHIARSLVGDKARIILTAASILLLYLGGFWLMALFVLFLSLQRHPGPLDDVSGLSRGRKILAVVLVSIFVLAFPIF
ncbi:MAG: site-2 protease family protein, partial [Candidatus Bathyarchaeia archaeon]